MSILLRIFRRPDYNSDTTEFIEQLKARKPDIEAQQRVGRSLLWDKHIDRDATEEWQAARVRQKSYVYFSQSGR
ncbi:DUF3460 family protein [Ramlibacter sp.]|uniref:DUF3460 family protein n=1 Tax=Ramlibacter sp. TaxID=1917967 RepID=UPI002B88AE67|nr:DUF3460 family protein [Ramlibacter sp.]HWI82845.1 DUF3460 family protein [Ramlibacter sp.]